MNQRFDVVVLGKAMLVLVEAHPLTQKTAFLSIRGPAKYE
jgi:hypothetical protein